MSRDFDRIYGQLTDLSLMSRPSTVTEALPIAGNVTTWIVQTAFHDTGTVVFLQSLDDQGGIREVIPAKVVQAIVRQDAALRARAADRRSEERKVADAKRAKLAAAKRVLAAQKLERQARLKVV